MGESSKLEIQIYRVDDFEHHVPESIDKAFKDLVKQAGKRYQSGDMYPVSSDEHEASSRRPVVENKIFHPHNEVMTEAIEDVNVQVYKVTQSATPDGVRSEGDDFIIHCPLEQIDALSNQIALYNQQSEEVEEYSITIREYRDKCKTPSNNECFIDIDENFKNHDPLASLFAKELTKRNIKKEDSTMTIATSEKQTVNLEFTLEQQLVVLNDEQYLTLFSLYGQEGINKYNKLTKDSKNLDEDKLDIVETLAELINNDNAEHKPELLELIAKYHLDYLGKDASLDSLKTQIKDTQKGLKDIVKGFKEQLDKLVSEDNLLLLKQEKNERKLNKARLRRQKRIERGLDAHLMAVACAVIEDGQEGGEQYIQKATQQANKVLNKAVAVVDEMSKHDEQPDPKSEEGMEKVFETCLPEKNKAKEFAAVKK